jgi:hypothetical protein
MTKKNETPITEVIQPDEVLSAEVAITPHKPAFDGDMLGRIIQLVSNQSGGLSARTAVALEIINSGVVPPGAIKTRPGAGGTKISYVSHVYATRLMNAAFGSLWDYEALNWEVFEDGSVATNCQMTISLPLAIVDGQPVFYTRKVTEIGSFEAYARRNANGEPIINPSTGKPDFTMNTADRVASAVSRALPKAMFRAFNLGTELFDAPEQQVTPEEAWKTLVNTGARVGLTRDEVKDIMVANNFKGSELPGRYQEAYELICKHGKKKAQEAPDF